MFLRRHIKCKKLNCLVTSILFKNATCMSGHAFSVMVSIRVYWLVTVVV